MKEDIKSKFGAIALEYDNQRRSLIPCFDDFYSCIVRSIAYGSKHGSILDVGAGTGLLTSFVYNQYPNSNYTVIDISEEMLQQAKRRFNNQQNFEFIIADYANYIFTNKYDVVVSALSIHHLEHDEKRKLYANIFGILNRGGVFINGDQFISRSKWLEEKIHERWKDLIKNSELTKDEINGAFERMKMDKPATVERNIEMLDNVGFTNVDLLYKYYPFGVICGMKK
jgi:tRNA (cmo5U34)-methyltransferase